MSETAATLRQKTWRSQEDRSMDHDRFDRIARALGAGATRRAGLKAAFAALVAGSGPAAALAGRDARDGGGKDRPADRRRGDADDDGADDAKRRRRCKPVGGRCRKGKRCCTGWCAKAKPGRKRRGVCQCREQGQPCTQTTNCCAVGGAQLQCIDGACGRLPVATGQACAEADTCADAFAACTTYRRTRDAAQTLCLLGAGAACTKDQACISLTCDNGRCVGGPAVVPTGDDCVPGQDICASSAATCAAYDAGSGGPAGAHCVLPNGDACGADRQCAAFVCTDGICGGAAVPTGDACVPGRDRCLDAEARCRAYAPGSGGPPGTFCTLSNGERCDADGQCYVNDCRDRRCGRDPVATGKDCDPSRDTCRDEPVASCRPYDPVPGAPAGDHCVVPAGAACGDDRDCAGLSCVDGTCRAAALPTGDACDPGASRCADPAATCTAYDAPGMPGGTYCLLRTGAPCASADVCEEAFCNAQGQCGPCTLIPNGSDETCETGAECCSGVCNVTGGVGRCIGPNQVYFTLSWTPEIDLDSWLWMPVGTPNASGTADNFPLGGDLLNYEEPTYPASGGPADAWTDVDDREGPGEERTIILRPIPGGTYRFAVANYTACPSDDGSTSACGNDWSALQRDVMPLSETDATVEFHVGGALVRTYRVPASTPGDQPSTHFYWWDVADVSFDAEGNYAGIVDAGGSERGELRDCMPNPYEMIGTFPMGSSRSNYCAPADGVPTGAACEADGEACNDPRASCVAYLPDSGGPAGTFCLLPEEARCRSDAVCETYACVENRCFGECGFAYEGALGQDDPQPRSLWFDRAGGLLYLSDAAANRIQVYGADGTFVREWGSAGDGDGEFDDPAAVTTSADGQRVYVADRGNDRIQVFDAAGAYLDQWPAPSPFGLGLTPNGLLAISLTEDGRIRLYTPDGTPTDASARIHRPGPLAVAPDGRLYAASLTYDQVYMFTSDLQFDGGWGYRTLGDVSGLAVAPDGSVLASSRARGLVFRATADGEMRCQIVPEETGPAAGIAAVAAGPDGTVYIGAAGPRTVYRYQGPTG